MIGQKQMLGGYRQLYLEDSGALVAAIDGSVYSFAADGSRRSTWPVGAADSDDRLMRIEWFGDHFGWRDAVTRGGVCSQFPRSSRR